MLMFCLIIACPACSGKAKTMDMNKLSTELLGSGVFAETLEPLDDSAIVHFYNVSGSDYDKALVYCSSGATSDELAIFHATDAAAAARISAAASERVKSQIAAFKNYVPAAVPKLESAHTVTYGDYVILCVSTDSAAADKIINKYIT
jgi:hypothetical protein